MCNMYHDDSYPQTIHSVLTVWAASQYVCTYAILNPSYSINIKVKSRILPALDTVQTEAYKGLLHPHTEEHDQTKKAMCHW